jgi:hypothetical protein
LKSLKLLIFCAIAFSSVAQTNSVSPYSRLGLGDVYHQLNTRQIGMGGTSMANYDGLNINFLNPASYNDLQLTTFNVGFEGTFINQSQSSPAITVSNNRSGMRNLSVGVPLTKWWGSALALMPYSFKGYDISSNRTAASDSNVAITDRFFGDGGLNSIIWGNSFQVAEGLSLGINGQYVFGSIRENTIIDYSSASFYDTRLEKESQIRGLIFKAGAKYHYEMEDDRFIAAGLTFQNGSTLRAENLDYQYTISGTSSVDTLKGGSTTSGDFTLGSDFGFGLSYGEKKSGTMQPSWAINVDYKTSNGDDFRTPDGSATLTNAYQLNVGSFLTPRQAFKKLERSTNFFNNVEYRFGGFYEKMPFQLVGTDLYNYGITFGLGLPIKQRSQAPGEFKVSTVNVGIMAGRRGSLENGLIQEEYLSIYIAVTFNDKWFIDYKYR